MAAVCGSGHVIGYANPAFCLLVDKSISELVGQVFADIVPAGAVHAADECRSLFERVYQTGQPQIHTGHEDVTPHSFFWSYALWPVLDRDGRTVGVMIQVTEATPFHRQATAINQALLLSSVRQHELAEAADLLASQLQAEIVARKRTNHALKESEERYRTLFELGPAAVYACDATGAIVDFNRRALELWGREPKRWASSDRFCGSVKLYLPDGTPVSHQQCPMADVLSGKISDARDMEVLVERPDGSSITCLVNIRALKNERGEIIGAINCFVDVTDRMHAQEEVRIAGERFRFLAESMPQKIFTASPAGEVTYFNQQWMEFSGLSFEQMKDLGWMQLIHPIDRPEILRRWQHSYATGDPFQFAHRVRRRDGVYRWHLSRALAMRDADNISMWVGSSTDIQEQKEVEAELRRVNEDLKQFAFAASHDLQEPLRMITSYSQMLIKGFSGQLDEEAAACVDFITKGTKQMRDLLADLLSYTKAGAEPGEGRESVDLNEVLEKVKQTLKPAIEESGAIVTSSDLPTIQDHESRFIQLFQNLVGNAIKYRGDLSPRITISAEKQNGEWHFAVADNGMGIDPQYHQRIFGVFKRLHGKAIPGTGIGLAICQRVIERCGGRIWVDSQIGRGATFYFVIPVTD
ncbi:MAG: PAS domain S-box protein [Acidobacteriota bacterium]